MKNVNFYTMFMNFRSETRSSIDGLNEIITGIFDKCDGITHSIDNVSATFSDGLHSVLAEDIEDGVRFTISEYVDKTHSIEEVIDIDTSMDKDELLNIQLPLIEVSLAQAIDDFNNSSDFNYALDSINTQLLNYGSVSRDYIYDKLNSINYQGADVIDYIKDTVGALPDDCNQYNWAAIITNLQKPLKDQGEEENNFQLQEKYVAISQYVGGAVVQAIASIIALVGAIIARINVIIGFCIALFGAAIAWVTNTVVNTSFTINEKGMHNDFDTPFLSYSDDYDPVSLNINLSTNQVTHVQTDTWYKDYWLGEDGKYYVNGFPAIYLHPDRFSRWLYETIGFNQATFTRGQVGINYYLSMHVPKTVWNSLQNYFHLDMTNIPADVYLQGPAELISLTDEQIAHAVAINNMISLFKSYTLTPEAYSGYSPAANADVCITAWASIAPRDIGECFATAIVKTISAEHYGSSGLFSSWLELASGFGDFNNNLLSNSGSLLSGDVYFLPEGGVVQWNKVTVRSYDYMPTNYVTTELVDWQKDAITTIASPVQVHTISWPDYAPSALLKSLAIFAAIAVAGATAISVGKFVINRFRNNYTLNQIKHLNELHDNYQSNPTKENLRTLNKATRWYNFKAKILGLRSYDSTNNWFNDYDSPNESNINSQNTVVGLQEVLNRIGTN